MSQEKDSDGQDSAGPDQWHIQCTDNEIEEIHRDGSRGLSRRSVMKAAGTVGVGAFGIGTGVRSFVDGAQAASNQVSFGDNVHLVNPTTKSDQDVEPQIASDAYGNLYTASIRGVPAGVDIWKSTDHGESWDYLGQPDGLPVVSDSTGIAPGGGDVALDVGTPYSGSPGNVYVSSLYLGSLYFSTSSDGGETWTTVNPVSSDVPGVDRQWVAAQGQQTVYQSFHDLETGDIDVTKSVDGGQTFTPVTPANGSVNLATTATSVEDNELGNILVDDNTGDLYQIFTAPADAQGNIVGNPYDTVYVSVSTDGGLTWTVNKAYTDPRGVGLDHIFPVVALDDASNAYAVWSDDHNIYYTASSDRGATWRKPVQVDLNGWGTNTSIFPWAVAGDAGVLDVTWYATNAGDNNAPNAKWKVYFNQVTNALSDPQIPRPVTASDHIIHTGSVCEGGTGCTGSGNRNLADVFYICLDPDGRAHIAYTDDHDSSLPPQTYTASQVGGPRAYANPHTFPLQFYVTGSRSDDASVFTGGQTDQIDLSITPMQDATVRDIVPTEWSVLTDASNDVDHVETDSNAGVKYVYFTQNAAANTETDYTYFVETPSGATQTGTYNFGPIEVKPDQYWVPVDGTGEINIVESQST